MNRSSLALLLCLTAATSFAQGKPTLVDYPLDVRLSLPPAQRAALKDDFRVLLARNPGVLVATRTTWTAALAAHKRQDCDVRNECLQQLAVAAGTLYGLYASIEQNAAGTEVRVTGRVVNRDGVAVRPHVLVTAPRKTTLREAAKAGLAELLSTMELSRLDPVLVTAAAAEAPPPLPPSEPVTPAVEPAPYPTPAPVVAAAPAPVAPAAPAATDAPKLAPTPAPALLPAPVAPPTEVATPAAAGPSGARVVAWITGGAAVVAAGVAAGLGVMALNERSALPADGRFLDEAQVASQRKVNELATMSAVTGASAGALAVLSAVLFASSSAPAAGVAVAPGSDGVHLVVSGRFGP